MKKVLLAVTCALTVGMFFNSCSMEKRHYMPGYHFDWNKNANHAVVKANDNSTPAPAVAIVNEQNNAAVTTQPVAVENTIAPVAVQEKATTTKSNGFHSVTKPVIAVEQAAKVNTNSTIVKQAVKAANKPAKQGGDVPKGLLYVLCILMPWLAVGLATDWDVKKIIINLLWSLTCIGGIIHAFIVVSKS
jgi:uncharacterized membrane protein YqaE (UPF0057 family)